MEEVTRADRDFALAAVGEPFREDVLALEWVVEVVSGTKTRSRLIGVTQYHLLVIKPGRVRKKRSLSRKYPLLQLSCVEGDTEAGSLVLDFVHPRELVLAGVSKELVQVLASRYAHVTWGWPDDVVVKFDAVVGAPSRSRVAAVPSPGGNLLESYRAISALSGWSMYAPEVDQYLCHTLADDVVWSKSLVLTEIPNVGSKSVSLKPLALALRFNAFFSRLVLTDVSRPHFLELLAFTLASNATLTELIVSHCGCKRGLGSLAAGMQANGGAPSLRVLDLSLNPLRDKGVSELGPGLDALPNLQVLNLQCTSLTGEGLRRLLGDRPADSPLHRVCSLDISHNKLGGADAAAALGAWLKRPQVVQLESLALGYTDLDLGAVLVSMGMSNPSIVPDAPFLSSLAHLDVAHLAIEARTATHVCTFLAATHNLSGVDVSNMRMHPGLLARVVAAFGKAAPAPPSQTSLVVRDLDLQANDAPLFLGSFGAFEALHTLVLDDLSASESVMLLLLDALKPFRDSLRVLSLNNAFKPKPKHRTKILAVLAGLLATGTFTSVSLSATESSRRLGPEGAILLDALASQNKASLTELDVTGHRMGSVVVGPLVQLLSDNEALGSLAFDENALCLDDFACITDAMCSATKLVECSLPVVDIKAMRSKATVETKLQITMLVKRIKEVLKSNAAALYEAEAESQRPVSEAALAALDATNGPHASSPPESSRSSYRTRASSALARSARARSTASSTSTSTTETDVSSISSLGIHIRPVPAPRPMRMRKSESFVSIASASSLGDIEAALGYMDGDGVGSGDDGAVDIGDDGDGAAHPGEDQERIKVRSGRPPPPPPPARGESKGMFAAPPAPAPQRVGESGGAASETGDSKAGKSKKAPPPLPGPRVRKRAPPPMPAPRKRSSVNQSSRPNSPKPPVAERRNTLRSSPLASPTAATAQQDAAEAAAAAAAVAAVPPLPAPRRVTLTAAPSTVGVVSTGPAKPPLPSLALRTVGDEFTVADSDDPESPVVPRASQVCSSIEQLLTDLGSNVDSGGGDDDTDDDEDDLYAMIAGL